MDLKCLKNLFMSNCIILFLAANEFVLGNKCLAKTTFPDPKQP